MNTQLMTTIAGILLTAGTAQVYAGAEATWSYSGDTGPDQWGDLSPSWAICGTGQYQSPIDIHNGIEAKLGGVSTSIKPTPHQIKPLIK